MKSALVLVDKDLNNEILEDFEYMGLSKEAWIEKIEKIIYRYFNDLENHLVYILFTDFRTNPLCEKFSGFFDAVIFHNSQNIYINTRGMKDLRQIVNSLVHELRHYHQIVNGQLTNESQTSYKEKFGINAGFYSFYDAPWEVDARNYELEVSERCYNILIS